MSDRMKQVEMLRGYLELVDRYTQMSSNPTNAGIAAVITPTTSSSLAAPMRRSSTSPSCCQT
jgi:hypothetical protein